uniref:ATP-dependent RNA helicase n=2 Tax=Ditylum brightwellii TaxID=49249 RepID=A0A6V2EIK1_9STRA
MLAVGCKTWFMLGITTTSTLHSMTHIPCIEAWALTNTISMNKIRVTKESRFSFTTLQKRRNIFSLFSSKDDGQEEEEEITMNDIDLDSLLPPLTPTTSTPLPPLSTVQSMGLNELQTLLRESVSVQDFDAAKLYRDELAERVSVGAYRPSSANGDEDEEDLRKKKRLSWKGLGAAPWLVDRLDALNYKFPTTIQINAFESVNTILGVNDSHNQEEEDDDDDETLEERLMKTPSDEMNMGVVISGSTGSGKTLAYSVPLLSTLSRSLFQRQRMRVKAEEDVGDVADDLLSRVAIQTSPVVRGKGTANVGGGKGVVLAGAALSSLGKGDEKDVTSPLALIVVPTRELGVQTALLLYELVGGSTKRTATEFSGLKNMFKYMGPKGVKIGCILDDNEAQFGLKLQTDIAITTPSYIEKLIRDGDIKPSKIRVIVYDEADLALEQTSNDVLQAIFRDFEGEREFNRLTYLVGASVTESLGDLAVRDKVLPEGKSFIATATRFAPLNTRAFDGSEESEQEDDGGDKEEIGSVKISGSNSRAASLKDLKFCLDPGLRHERIIAPDDTGLVCLARLLRKELHEYEELAAAVNTTNTTTLTKLQRPRVVVFFPDEAEAQKAISSLRDAMWGDHKLCVLLPNIGVNPLTVMENFKAGETSVMLATPNSVRGLDFPDLTHVYTSYLPVDDPREYLHLAGRVGRIGQMGSVIGRGGRVTSILRPEESEKMDDLAKELGFNFVDVPYEKAKFIDSEYESDDVEDARRYLEDMMTLLNLATDPEISDNEDAQSDVIVDEGESDDNDDE